MFDQSYHVRYRIDRADVIVSANGDWNHAALFNDAPELASDNIVGQSIWTFIHGDTVKHLYLLIFEQARAGKTLQFEFRCNVGEIGRMIDVVVRPAESGEIIFESRFDKREYPPSHVDPPDLGGNFSDLIVTCSWCRRIRVGVKAWCDVEEAIHRLRLFELADVPQMSHGMCGSCFTDAVAKLRN